MICSLGRFAEDKRQIEQIHIAEKLPDYQFHIMGFAKEGDTYFKECKHLIEKKNLNNIFLYPTVDYSQMNQIFEESGFFIHSIRYEPFGIVTVEAISKRCIPIVHDSGGQKEIVSVDKLRYRDINEAVSLFKELAILDVTVFHKWIQQLTQNVREFNFANFREKFNRIFETKFKVGEIDQ